MLRVLAAVAAFERYLIIERTQAGQVRAQAEGKHMGRPSKTTDADKAAIRQQLATEGATVSQVARDYGISRASVISIRDATA
jgi:putative DNA-invertase from lambdoid prophage Rac